MKVPLACVVAIGLATGAANAIIIFDSTGNVRDDYWGTTGLYSLSQSFMSGSESGTISGLKLLLKSATSDFPYTVKLYSDNSGAPGSSLGPVVTNSLIQSAAYTLYDVTLDASQPTMAANTKYWINISTPAPSGTLQWGATTSTLGTGVATNHTLYVDNNLAKPGQSFIMQLSESAAGAGGSGGGGGSDGGSVGAPEPGTVLMGLSALAIGAGYRMRQWRRKRG